MQPRAFCFALGLCLAMSTTAWPLTLDRPPGPGESILPLRDQLETEHFMIHYTLTGPDAAPDMEYVYSVADACETSWTMLHTTLGWHTPPSDGTEGGGLNKIDCTILDVPGGVTGFSQLGEPVPGDPPFDFTGDFYIDNAIMDLCLRQTTVAHQYMHVVEYGYYGYSNASWFMENCAALAEEWVFDDSNNYRTYLPAFLSSLYRSLMTHNGAFELGGVLWPMFLAERFEPALVEGIWDRVQWSGNIFTAHEDALGEYGYTMGEAYLELVRWCFYTGYRCDDQHFEEACSWPVILYPDQTYQSYPTGERHPLASRRPESLGTSIIELQPEAGSMDNTLTVGVNGPDCILGVQLIAKVMDAGSPRYVESRMSLDEHGDGAITIAGFDSTEYVLVFVSMGRTCSGAQDYVYWAGTYYDLSDAGQPDEDATGLTLDPRLPSPACGPLQLGYTLGRGEAVRLQIVDVAGRPVCELVNDRQEAGHHEIAWTGRDDRGRPAGSGIYWVRLQGGQEIRTRKILLLE
jgi:hypothetical protein